MYRVQKYNSCKTNNMIYLYKLCPLISINWSLLSDNAINNASRRRYLIRRQSCLRDANVSLTKSNIVVARFKMYLWPGRFHAEWCENAEVGNKSMYHKDNYSDLFPEWDALVSANESSSSPSTSSNIYVIYRVFAAPRYLWSVKVFYDNDI